MSAWGHFRPNQPGYAFGPCRLRSESDRNAALPQSVAMAAPAILPPDQIGRQCRQGACSSRAEALSCRSPRRSRHILAFDIARFLQTLVERRDLLAQRSGRCGVEEAGHRHRRLLCARGGRPRCRAAEQSDEIAPPHGSSPAEQTHPLGPTRLPSRPGECRPPSCHHAAITRRRRRMRAAPSLGQRMRPSI
jgi:hypothetical protein